MLQLRLLGELYLTGQDKEGPMNEFVLAGLSGLLGVIVGGGISYLLMVKQITYSSRLNYINSMLSRSDVSDQFKVFLDSVYSETGREALRGQIDKVSQAPWFKYLFTPARKRRDEIVAAIKIGDWSKVNSSLTNFLMTKW